LYKGVSRDLAAGKTLTNGEPASGGWGEGGRIKEGENGKIIYNITCPYLPVK